MVEGLMVKISDDQARCEFIAGILKALGHPLRFRIVAMLCDEQRHVGAIAAAVNAPQAAVSSQLAILRTHGLVKSERVQGKAVYHIAEPRLHQLVECMEGCRHR